MELDHPYLNATFWRTTTRGAWPLQVRLDELLEAVVAGKPDEVSDPLLFAKLVEIRTCKCCIPLEEIIKGIAVVSGNDSCVAAAEHVAGALTLL